jgi:uncharacterized Zn finger protein (UPF0148 family)
MRLRSEFHLICAACAAPIVTETATGACPKCGTGYEIQWTAEYQPKTEKPENTHDLS